VSVTGGMNTEMNTPYRVLGSLHWLLQEPIWPSFGG